MSQVFLFIISSKGHHEINSFSDLNITVFKIVVFENHGSLSLSLLGFQKHNRGTVDIHVHVFQQSTDCLC